MILQFKCIFLLKSLYYLFAYLFIYLQDSIKKLNKMVTDFVNKFGNKDDNATLNTAVPKYCKIEDLSNNDGLDTDAMDIIESIPELPTVDLSPDECHLISMDTDIIPECDVIAKPEEAGGIRYNYT